MANVLSRYLNPQVISRIAGRAVDPRGLVVGNLAGAHKSPLSGFAVEFAGHREYVAGDDPKHIDWRLYFTRDKYFIKQYEMETNFVCHLVMDVSASMRYGDDLQQKLLYGAQLITALAYAIIQQNDKVSLTTFDDQVRGHVRPSNSMGQLLKMTEHLDEIAPVEKTNMGNCLGELVSRMGRREIVMVVSDFLTDLEELEPAIQRMCYHGHEVVLLQVLHHHEHTFNFEGMVKFAGLETDDEFLTQTEDIRTGYLSALRDFDQRFAELCQRNRVERVLIDTSRNLAEVLIDYLNQRSESRRRRR
ncbi:MAG: DUF58 domain-containing protein [Planctomycetaceae bacterium]